MNYYVGNPLQIRGCEQYILQNGKGNGMRFLCVRNGLGLEAWISLDRCADVSRLTFKGDNMGYFSPCGYVAPSYYDHVGTGFLKSFTAGFFTTCGLSAVGSPCFDDGEQLPLHGTIANTPAELVCREEMDDGLHIKATVRDCVLFGRKLVLKREYVFSYTENIFSVKDEIENLSDKKSPYMLLYHCNMGYPLLDENAIVKIPNHSVTPRDEQAKKHIENALIMEKPQTDYEECCYYYDVIDNCGKCNVGIFNPNIDKGVVISYNKSQLPSFTEWKMMGKMDYALGLEPGNCTPDGRDVMRKNGKLEFLDGEQSAITELSFKFVTDKIAFNKEF